MRAVRRDLFVTVREALRGPGLAGTVNSVNGASRWICTWNVHLPRRCATLPMPYRAGVVDYPVGGCGPTDTVRRSTKRGDVVCSSTPRLGASVLGTLGEPSGRSITRAYAGSGALNPRGKWQGRRRLAAHGRGHGPTSIHPLSLQSIQCDELSVVASTVVSALGRVDGLAGDRSFLGYSP